MKTLDTQGFLLLYQKRSTNALLFLVLGPEFSNFNQDFLLFDFQTYWGSLLRDNR